MLELNATGVERNATVGVGAWSTILKVALDGTTDFSQLAPYLVVASCVQFYLKQPVTVAAGKDTIVQNGLLGTGNLAVVGACRIVLRVAGKPVSERSLLLWRLVGYDGPIGFLHGACAEHLAESAEGLAGAGKKNQTADGAVQSMHHAEEHFPGLLVLFLDVCLHHLGQGYVACLVTLHDVPRPFADDDDVIILVNR